jgi:hypothetical protein
VGVRCDPSKRGFSAVAGADANYFFECSNKDFAIADFSGPRTFGDGLDNLRNQVVRGQDGDLYFRKERNRVLGAAVDLGMAL